MHEIELLQHTQLKPLFPLQRAGDRHCGHNSVNKHECHPLADKASEIIEGISAKFSDLALPN